MDRITEFLQEHEWEIFEELAEIIAIPSVKGAPEDGAPFGREVKRMLETVARLGQRHGYTVTLYDEYLLMEYGEGEKTLGVFCHGDVVPVDETEWTTGAPFALHLWDGFLTGRGVRDDKGAIIQALWLPDLLRAAGEELSKKLVVFIGGSEETGMEDIDAFVRRHPMPDVSVTPDNQFPVSVGEKTILHITARSGRLRDVVGVSGGIAENLMMSRVTVKLRDTEPIWAALRQSGLEVRHDSGGIEVISTAPAVHAAACADYHSAMLPVAAFFADCPALCEGDRAQLAIAARLLSDGRGTAFGVAGSDGGFGENTCCNGIAAMEGDRMELHFDFRISGGSDAEKAAETIRRAVEETGWEVAAMTYRAGFMLPEDSEEVRRILAACERVSGRTGLRPYYSGGGTYASHLKNAYSIAAVADYLPLPEPPLAQGHGDEHQPDETVSRAAYLESFRHLLAVVTELGK